MIEEGTITCPCGTRITFDGQEKRLDCDCGANYIVTVTRITAPSDG